jgi:hypothetical protein
MKKVLPYDAGLTFWSEMIKKIDHSIYISSITNPVIRTMQLKKYNLTENDFKIIHATALYEVYCFAAYSVNSQIKPGNIPTIKRLKTIQNLINFQISSGNFIGIIKI